MHTWKAGEVFAAAMEAFTVPVTVQAAADQSALLPPRWDALQPEAAAREAQTIEDDADAGADATAGGSAWSAVESRAGAYFRRGAAMRVA
jgi:hypothetical protein